MILSVWIELSVFPHTSMVIKIRNNNSGVSTICIIIVLVLRQFYDCGMREARCQLYWRSRWHVSIKIHTCDLGRSLTILIILETSLKILRYLILGSKYTFNPNNCSLKNTSEINQCSRMKNFSKRKLIIKRLNYAYSTRIEQV